MDKILTSTALGASLLQVMISIGLTLLAYQIWRRLDDVEALQKRARRNERQTHLLARTVSNITSYCRKNDEAVSSMLTLLESIPNTTDASEIAVQWTQDLEIVEDDIKELLSELRIGTSIIALGGEQELIVQSTLMYLSQVGTAEDYELSIDVLLSRLFVDTGDSDVNTLPNLRQEHLKIWRNRLRQSGHIIVHATWAPQNTWR